jgi:hypothetical protein
MSRQGVAASGVSRHELPGLMRGIMVLAERSYTGLLVLLVTAGCASSGGTTPGYSADSSADTTLPLPAANSGLCDPEPFSSGRVERYVIGGGLELDVPAGYIQSVGSLAWEPDEESDRLDVPTPLFIIGLNTYEGWAPGELDTLVSLDRKRLQDLSEGVVLDEQFYLGRYEAHLLGAFDRSAPRSGFVPGGGDEIIYPAEMTLYLATDPDIMTYYIDLRALCEEQRWYMFDHLAEMLRGATLK